MHVLSARFLDAMESAEVKPVPVINLHPALPGAFDGVDAIHRAYAAYQRGEIDHTGVMVHRVVKEVDRGEPVVVREIVFEKSEPEAEFEARLHRVEWEVIVEATRKILEETKAV